MERTIDIDLTEQFDFLEKYNKESISRQLLEYIKGEAIYLNNNDNVKIIIHRKCKMPNNYIEIFKYGLKKEYVYYKKKLHFNNILQIVFLICGFILLFLSHKINNAEVLEEILLISGWVFIWEMIEMQLFSDSKIAHNCKVLKKILKSEIREICEKDLNVL